MSSCACVQQPQFVPVVIKEPKLKLSLEVRESRGLTVVYCKGRIVCRDGESVLLDKVADVLSHTRQVVLDLSGVEMIDGAGLGELVAIYNYADARGCSVKLAGPNRIVYSLLKLTHLTSLFEIVPALSADVVAKAQIALEPAQC